MNVLGIESSCDETSVAIISDGVLKSNLISSQDFHRKFGGVVPELSSHAHLQQIIPLLKDALNQSGLELNEIDLICATAGPGLVGALLVGFTFGKSLALALDKPFVPVNHIEAHIFSGFLMNEKPEYPYLCNVVSGGHTLLLLVNSEFDIVKLGSTIDDAVGEAFDKVAKMMSMEYPGGPSIQRYAESGDPQKIKFPVARCKNIYDFSFSGLKTSVLRYLQKEFKDIEIPESAKSDIAASFQYSAVKAIIEKNILALEEFKVKSISLVGGVAANSLMREELNNLGRKHKLDIVIPDLQFCGDNAAMIAHRGFLYHNAGKVFSLNENVYPSLPDDIFSKVF